MVLVGRVLGNVEGKKKNEENREYVSKKRIRGRKEKKEGMEIGVELVYRIFLYIFKVNIFIFNVFWKNNIEV